MQTTTAEKMQLGRVTLHIGDYEAVIWYRYPKTATLSERSALAEKAVAKALQEATWSEKY